MTGLFLLFFIVLWVVFIIWLISHLVRFMPSKLVKAIAIPVLFIFLLIFPVLDEIIGGIQFRSLCREGAILNVDEEKVKNKTVISQDAPNTNLSGYFVPIRQQYWSYKDEETGEVVISWNAYHAKGGLFIRGIGISETDAPLTFHGVCYPGGTWPKIFKNLNITVKDRK